RGDYFSDLKHGRLPNVSWIIPSFARGLDEHPPADVSIGMGIQEDLITALRESSASPRSAFLLTYDEHGGYFDHVAPPQLDAYGLSVFASSHRSNSRTLTSFFRPRRTHFSSGATCRSKKSHEQPSEAHALEAEELLERSGKRLCLDVVRLPLDHAM